MQVYHNTQIEEQRKSSTYAVFMVALIDLWNFQAPLFHLFKRLLRTFELL